MNKDYLHGLDMVHQAIWQMREDAKKTGSRIVNVEELSAVLLILIAVMKQLDDGTLFGGLKK